MVCVAQLPLTHTHTHRHTHNNDEVDDNLHHLVSLSSCNVMTLPSEVSDQFLKQVCTSVVIHINPLPVQFKAVLRGQKGCVFFSGHLNLPTTPEIGLPSRKKNHNN